MSDITAGVTFVWTDATNVVISESSSVAYSSSDETQSSVITVTPDADTTYTCTVTDSNGVAATGVPVVLNVFSMYFC